MSQSIDKEIRILKGIFLRCFIVFALITLIGLALMHTYNDRMNTIEVGCGLHVNQDMNWVTRCTDTYSRHHVGYLAWWAPIFVVGATGAAIFLIAFIVTFSPKRKRVSPPES